MSRDTGDSYDRRNVYRSVRMVQQDLCLTSEVPQYLPVQRFWLGGIGSDFAMHQLTLNQRNLKHVISTSSELVNATEWPPLPLTHLCV